MKSKNLIIVGIFILLISAINIFAQNDFKMRQRMNMAGRAMESAVMIKGSRERSESEMMGSKNITITECDLKRTIQINETEKKYYIEPMGGAEPAAPAQPTKSTTTTRVKSEKGCFVTRTLEIIDTGERQQMFGMTARHIKTIMTSDPSPDACEKDKQRIETDGWYVDLNVGFSCKFDRPPDNPMTSYRGGSSCTDQTKFIQKGTGKLGYALKVTTKISMGDDEEDTDPQMAGMMNMSTEILELSRATLPQSLFEIPEGYTEVKNQSELYGKATQKTMGSYMQKNGPGDMMPSGGVLANSAGAKKPGTVRVGVMAVSNSSGKPLSTDMYQSVLVSQIKGGNVEAVAISSADDAKRLNCDYILNTDIKALKQSTASKVGGMFGKVTGTGSGEGKVEVTVGYDLKPLGADGTTLQMQSTTAKIEGQENSVMTALSNESQAVMKALKK